MSSSSLMIGSSVRVESSRTSIAIGRLPDGEGRAEGAAASAEALTDGATTERVANLVRCAAHENAGRAADEEDPARNHDCHANQFGRKMPPRRSGIFPTFTVRMHASALAAFG